jgi:hypothetical protein
MATTAMAASSAARPIIDYSLMVTLDDDLPPTDLIARITPDLTEKMTDIKMQYDVIFKNASKARKCRKELDTKYKTFDDEQMAAQKAIFENVTATFEEHSELSTQSQKVKEYVGACIRHFQSRGAQYQTSAHPLVDAATREYLNTQSAAANEFVTLLNDKFAPTSHANLGNINTEMKNTAYELGKIAKYFPDPQEASRGWGLRAWWNGGLTKARSESDSDDAAAVDTEVASSGNGDGTTSVVHGPATKPVDVAVVEAEDDTTAVAQAVVKKKPAPEMPPAAQVVATGKPQIKTGVKFVDAEDHTAKGKTTPLGRRRQAGKKKKQTAK